MPSQQGPSQEQLRLQMQQQQQRDHQAREQRRMQTQMQMQMQQRAIFQQQVYRQQQLQQGGVVVGQSMGQPVTQQGQMAQQMPQQMGMPPTMAFFMGTPHDDIVITEPNDLNILNGQAASHPEFASFRAACRAGELSAVESIVRSRLRTPAFLHQGLVLALSSGKVDVARHLLASGAPIARNTPTHILSAPEETKIPLFEVLAEHGWTPNTPGFYGAVLLPRVVTNDTLLDWFLAHGADPNLGAQRDNRDRNGGPDTDSCSALETASRDGSAEAVRKLLNAGAEIRNGAPLYFAAGACPPGANPHAGPVKPSKEFDEARVPVMALLVENGAGVNDKLESRHMTPQYPIVNAVMAGAVERVRWLLSQGADPDLKGQYGSANEVAKRIGDRMGGNEEMLEALGLN
ncbi:hypothetical protein F66182_4867 [Fusarium sp. NRRL 66182]|nr:hypothetical protein F66182_4867 [Fusarium sp. NRRL 66182]